MQFKVFLSILLHFLPSLVLPFDEENETSRLLTRQLLDLDLGYHVFNTEILKRLNDSPFDEEVDYGFHEEEEEGGGGSEDSFRGDFENEESFYPKDRHPRDYDLGDEDLWPSESFWPHPVTPFRRPGVFRIFTPYRRGRLRRPHQKTFVGDQHKCGTGSCEFFLFCWLTGGLIEGGCGGFLFACCQRPSSAGTQVIIEKDKKTRPELEYGPVENEPSCGISNNNRNVAQRRIVGGDEAGFGSFPWQAYIRIGTSRCGGSLVNEWYVITAGHCVARASPSQVRVTLGEYVLKSDAEPLPGRTYGASRIKVHPYFKFTPQADRFDVAVIRLNRRVDYAPHISPICLPPKNMEMSSFHGWASGWGALEPGSRLRPKTLQVVDVPMIPNRECEKWHRRKGINVIIYDEMVCAGYFKGGKDSCQGDSGGPLMTEIDGRWTLIGIVSAGYSCAKRGQPGIYHRVPHTADWISYSIHG